MARSSTKKKPEKEPEYEVEAIKDHERKKGTLKYLIKWKGYNNPKDNTWEPEAEINPVTQVVERYWKSKQAAERLDRYKVGSKEYKRLHAELLAEEEEEEEGEEEEEEEEEEKKKSSSKKGKSPVKRGGKRKSSDSEGQVGNGSSNKKAKKEKSVEVAEEEETVTEVEANGVVENGAEEEEEEQQEVGSQGYDPAGRALIPWKEITAVKKAGSWEDLVFKIDTVDKDEDSKEEPFGIKMLCIWNKEDHNGNAFESWVPEPITRKTCPQKMLDFYKSNLKFRTTETEEDIAKLDAEEAVEGGGEGAGEGEGRQDSPAHGEVEL